MSWAEITTVEIPVDKYSSTATAWMESDVRSSAISTDPVECSSCNSVDLCMNRHFVLQVTVHKAFRWNLLDAYGKTVVSQTDDLRFDKYAADLCSYPYSSCTSKPV